MDRSAEFSPVAPTHSACYDVHHIVRGFDLCVVCHVEAGVIGLKLPGLEDADHLNLLPTLLSHQSMQLAHVDHEAVLHGGGPGHSRHCDTLGSVGGAAQLGTGMGAQVLGQIILPRKSPTAVAAVERPLASMDSLMFPQVTPLYEPLATLLANCILRSRMRLHVNCVSGPSSEVLGTVHR